MMMIDISSEGVCATAETSYLFNSVNPQDSPWNPLESGESSRLLKNPEESPGNLGNPYESLRILFASQRISENPWNPHESNRGF